MKIYRKKLYVTSVMADKGKVFSDELLQKANLLSEEELLTVKYPLDGHVLEYVSTLDFSDIPDEKMYEWFSKVQVSK
jgi:hypothetical protein